MAEWSKLSFSSLELLAHSVGCRFESCQRLLFFYLYSVSTNKKLSHPSSLWVWMRSCHTMVKSAVLPKTTSLCTSITVITLWVNGTVTPELGFFAAPSPYRSVYVRRRYPARLCTVSWVSCYLLQSFCSQPLPSTVLTVSRGYRQTIWFGIQCTCYIFTLRFAFGYRNVT